ncbi:hypothetical protein ACWOEH_08725 [Enterococcus nangangensis]
MNNILVADFILVEAHRTININIIDAISRNNVVSVVNINGYFDDVKEKWIRSGIEVISKNISMNANNSIASRYFGIKVAKLVSKISKNNNYDLVISLGFDTIAYSFSKMILKKTPIALFHHKNIDELQNKLKLFLFNRYKNQVNHLVFEQFFKDHLTNKLGVKQNLIYVIPHPVESINLDKKSNENKYTSVGLCNSNSEEFVSGLLRLNPILAENDIWLLLRSKTREGDYGNIRLVKGFLNLNTYSNFINSAQTVLVPIPSNYVYRLSGSIYDGLCRKKIVYTTSKFYGQEYEKRYPGICIFIKNETDYIENLKKTIAYREESFEKFIKDHSINSVSFELKKSINSMIAMSGACGNR